MNKTILKILLRQAFLLGKLETTDQDYEEWVDMTIGFIESEL